MIKNWIAFVVLVAALAVAIFSAIGIVGVALGSDDDLTRAFVKIVKG